jgi:hypothetical protein
MSVLHRCTSSSYLYSIFKHFFIQLAWQIMNVLSCMGIQHYHILQIHMAITNSHFPIICGCLRVLVSNTYCVVFLFCLSSSCASFSRLSICIDPSVFSKVFFIMQNNGMRHCFKFQIYLNITVTWIFHVILKLQKTSSIWRRNRLHVYKKINIQSVQSTLYYCCWNTHNRNIPLVFDIIEYSFSDWCCEMNINEYSLYPGLTVIKLSSTISFLFVIQNRPIRNVRHSCLRLSNLYCFLKIQLHIDYYYWR